MTFAFVAGIASPFAMKVMLSYAFGSVSVGRWANGLKLLCFYGYFIIVPLVFVVVLGVAWRRCAKPTAAIISCSALGVGHAIGWHGADKWVRVREVGGWNWPSDPVEHFVAAVLFVLCHTGLAAVFVLAALAWRRIVCKRDGGFSKH